VKPPLAPAAVNAREPMSAATVRLAAAAAAATSRLAVMPAAAIKSDNRVDLEDQPATPRTCKGPGLFSWRR